MTVPPYLSQIEALQAPHAPPKSAMFFTKVLVPVILPRWLPSRALAVDDYFQAHG